MQTTRFDVDEPTPTPDADGLTQTRTTDADGLTQTQTLAI